MDKNKIIYKKINHFNDLLNNDHQKVLNKDDLPKKYTNEQYNEDLKKWFDLSKYKPSIENKIKYDYIIYKLSNFK